jgi:hypothetical protein
MYSFKHRYHHPQGHPIARLVKSYNNDYWELLQKCWYIQGLQPYIHHYRNDDYTWDEIVWGWNDKETHDRWVQVAGANWNQALIIGLQYSDAAGVTQVRGQPGPGMMPSDGMVETTIDAIKAAYG